MVKLIIEVYDPHYSVNKPPLARTPVVCKLKDRFVEELIERQGQN